MNVHFRMKRAFAPIVAALLALLTAPAAHAQLYWDSNGTVAGAGATPTGTWGTSAFWNTDSAGGAGTFSTATANTDNLFFVAGPGAASGNNAYTVTVNLAQVANSLTFQASGATTISGGTSITLGNGTAGAGGITMNPFAFGSTVQGAVTISTAVILNNSQTWTNNAVANLSVSGGLDLGTSTLTIDGTGTTNFGGVTPFITGSGGITKNGTGQLILSGAGTLPLHNYSGTTTVNGGTILIQGGNNSTGTGNVILNGGVLNYYFGASYTRALGTGAGAIQIIGGVSGFSGQGATGTTFTTGASVTWGSATFNPTEFVLQTANTNANGNSSYTSNINLNGADRTIRSDQNSGTTGNGTFSGVISNSTGTAGLIKTGVGHHTLSNTNTYNGTTTITQGILTANSTAALGNSSVTNTLIFNGGILRAGGAITSVAARGVTMAATGIIDTNTFAVSIAGNITGAGGLTKNSTGTLTLSGTNDYAGATTVNAGTLVITRQLALYNNSPASWTAANINVRSGATLQLNVDSAGVAGFDSGNLNTLLGNFSVANTAAQGLQAGATLVFDTSTATGGTFTPSSAIANSTGAFGGVISLTKIGAGTLILSGTNTYTGPTTITAGTLQLDTGGVIATPIRNNAAFATNSASAATQGTHFGLISGTGTVTQSGAGTLTLNLANTYSGATTVSTGTLAVANALALQNSALVTTSGTSTYSGAGALTIGGLSGATGDLGSANVLNGYTGVVTALTLNPQTGVSVTYGGIISNGSGTTTLTKTGAGTQILTGANSYTGATIVNAGTLTIGVGGSLGSSDLQINGGTFSYGNTAAGQTLNGLTVGAGNSTVSNTATGQTLALGGITRTASTFGTVNFATLTGPISTTTGNTNGIIGPWATTGSTTTLRYAVGSPDGTTPTNISAFAGTAATANTLANVTDATANYEYSAAVAAMPASTALTGNTLRYSGGATSTALNATSSITLNGLMQAGTGLLTISGGPTTGGILIGSTGELVIAANAQATTISAAIGGTGRLVYSGAGSILTLGLSASTTITNTYSGGTVINSGTVTLLGLANNDVNAILGGTSGGITLNGGQLRVTSANLSAARIVTVGVGGGSLFVNRNNNFTTTGQLTGSGTLTTLDGGGGGTNSTYSFNATTNNFTGRLIGTNTNINVNSFANSANNIVLDGATFNYGTGATSAASLTSRAIELSGTTGGATVTNSNATAANIVTIGGGLVITGVGNKTFTLGGTNTGNNSFAGSITDGPGSVISLTKTLAGTWVLGSANTFTGATTVSAGRLSLNNLNAIANSSSISVASGGTLGFAIGGTYTTAGSISIAGTGASLPGGAGALWFGQGGSYASTLNAPINLTAAATIGSFGNVMTQTLGGAVTGTGPLTIQSQGGTTTDSATWILNAASTYSGNTVFTTSGGVFDMTVRLGVNNALPTTTSLNLQSSNSQNVATFTTFDLNGLNQTLAGLTDTGGTMSGALGAGKRVINSSATLSTLTINNAGAVTYGTTGTNIRAGTIGGATAAGVAANNVALVKTGPGTLTLSGASSFTGNVTISNGTLLASLASAISDPIVSPLGNPQSPGRQVLVGNAGTLNFGSNDVMGNGGSTPLLTLVANGGVIRNNGNFFNVLGPVQLNGGTLSSFGGSSAAFPSFYLNGTVTVGGSAVSTISNTGANSQFGLRNAGTTFDVADAVVGSGSDLNVPGVLANFNSSPGALIKSGIGTMTLSGINTYTGATQVNAGTLLLGASGALPTGSATVLNGGTLAVASATANATTGSFTVSANSAIDFGGSMSLTTLSFGSAPTWAGTLTINGYTGPGQSTGSTSTQLFIGGTSLTQLQLDAISFTGYSAGVTQLGSGEVVPVGVVPEPGTILGLAAIGMGLTRWVRRRKGAAIS